MPERKRKGQIDMFSRRVRMSASDYKRSASEFQLACSVADALRRWCAKGWKWGHYPAGEERPTSAGARLKRMGAQSGWPDLMLFPPQGGTAYFMELKRPKGGVQSDEQKDFAAWAMANSYRYVICRDLIEAMAVLRTWGALRV